VCFVVLLILRNFTLPCEIISAPHFRVVSTRSDLFDQLTQSKTMTCIIISLIKTQNIKNHQDRFQNITVYHTYILLYILQYTCILYIDIQIYSNKFSTVKPNTYTITHTHSGNSSPYLHAPCKESQLQVNITYMEHKPINGNIYIYIHGHPPPQNPI
jgi:hypothetical protein